MPLKSHRKVSKTTSREQPGLKTQNASIRKGLKLLAKSLSRGI